MKRHHWIVRLTHWGSGLLIVGLVTSGLQIYRAYPRFGERGDWGAGWQAVSGGTSS